MFLPKIRTDVESAQNELLEVKKLSNELSTQFKTLDFNEAEELFSETYKNFKEFEKRRKEFKEQLNELPKIHMQMSKEIDGALQVFRDIKKGRSEADFLKIKSEVDSEVYRTLKENDSGLEGLVSYEDLDLTQLYKKGNLTTRGRLRVSAQATLDQMILAAYDNKKRREAEEKAIATKCAELNLGSAPYIKMLDLGSTLEEVLSDLAMQAKRQSEEQQIRKVQKLKKEIKGGDAQKYELKNIDIIFPDLETAKAFKEWMTVSGCEYVAHEKITKYNN